MGSTASERLFGGRYEILESLGSGAQGLAVKVRDTLSDGQLAVLKLGLSGRESLDGTIREFEALRALATPYTAPVIDLGFAGPGDIEKVAATHAGEDLSSSDQPRAFLVRHWVEGEPIVAWSRRLRKRGVNAPLTKIVEVLAHVAEGVADLHRSGIVHGDLKPEHVLVTEGGGGPRPLLIDFGLAARGHLGTLGGTPGYLAPERLRGLPANRSSDRFALGVVFVQALCGERLPVRSASTVADLPQRLQELDLPARVRETARRLLDPDPAQRPSLDSVRTSLLPPSKAVEGWRSSKDEQLPFLGVARRNQIGHLVDRARAGERASVMKLAPVVLVVGQHGSGRSRTLRQIGWGLQSRGRPVFELTSVSEPMGGLLRLGPQLASLAGLPYSAPDAGSFVGDRARWIREVAASLTSVVPRGGAGILWDDVGEVLAEGMDMVEALALVVERSHGRVRLWTTTTPDRVADFRAIFASAGFEIAELAPLSRGDLDGLQGLTHRGRPLSHGDLNRLHRHAQGLPARLVRLLGNEEDTAEPQPEGPETWLVALAGMVPGGATAAEFEAAASHLGVREDVTLLVAQALAAGHITTGAPRPDSTERTFAARTPDLRSLEPSVRAKLGGALDALGVSDPVVAVLAAALQSRPTLLMERWQRERGRMLAMPGRGPVMTVLELALESLESPELLDTYVNAALEGGELARAQRVLGELAARGVADRSDLMVARARLAFAAGDLGTVEEFLDGVSDDLDALAAGHAQHLRAQVDLRRGRYASARRRAQEAAGALDDAQDGAGGLRAELWVTASAASSLLGEEGKDALEAATAELAKLDVSARVRARHKAFSAVAATVRGDLDAATEGYRSALEIVEEEGLDADRPLYLLNLGTAYERQVRLSMAREYYELGVRCCLPTTRPSTRALLLANRANLDIRLGRTSEARELLGAAARIAKEASLGAVSRFVRHLDADADAADGRLEAAAPVLASCAEDYRIAGDLRHACELSLSAGLVSVRSGDLESGRRLLAAAEADMADFPDLAARASILHAEIDCARGGLEYHGGIDRYLRALERALDAGDDLTVLENARWLRRRMTQHGGAADPLAEEELQGILERAWRRVALGLKPELRSDLARHLELPMAVDQERRSTRPPESNSAMMSRPTVPAVVAHGASGSVLRPSITSAPLRLPDPTKKFYRMLSLNRRILGETERDRLIPAALDIALELSGAERGFVLLQKPGESGFEVAFSRDVDGRPISGDQLEISETVALEVATTGRPVVTVNASEDERFGQAVSVHRLQLTSILCLPIKDRDRTLGCLYLDHRSQAGVFDGEVPNMLGAYADQVAIALMILARTREVEDERDRLVAAQAQIQALLKDKEELLMNLETRCELLEADLARERSSSGLRYNYDTMIAESPSMRRVLALTDRVVDAEIPVVIRGESGTGKELVARAIHFNGPRRTRAFTAINCGALNEELLESELFGHKKGAFTGAISDRKGLFEAADGGTLFLDEVGEMSLGMQVKLLRAVQEQRVRPVGSSHEVKVDVRIVAATHRDLTAMVAAGTFREDLFYRLATIVIVLPPLRERPTDIPLLVRAAIKRYCEQTGRQTPEVEGAAVRLLMSYAWPGNIRQLENVVRAALVMGDGVFEIDTLRPLLVGLVESGDGALRARPARVVQAGQVGRPVKRGRDEVADALRVGDGNRRVAAEILGVSLRTLQRYVAKYGLD